MGKCLNCEADIILREGEKKCPNCGEYPYICWDCKEHITEESKGECNLCGYFKCANCENCGSNCSLGFIISDTLENFPQLKIIERDILEQIFIHAFELKSGKVNMHCNQRGVFLSYAKVKNRLLLRKLRGMQTKKDDSVVYEGRYEYIKNLSVGTSFTISDKKEKGHYGFEWRDTTNLAVCLGKLKKESIEEKNNKWKIIKKYDLFTRVENQVCPYAVLEDPITKFCPNCRKIYPELTNFCLDCKYKKGRKKGQQYDLHIKKSFVSFCKLNRKEFIPIKEVDTNGKRDDIGRDQ